MNRVQKETRCATLQILVIEFGVMVRQKVYYNGGLEAINQSIIVVDVRTNKQLESYGRSRLLTSLVARVR